MGQRLPLPDGTGGGDGANEGDDGFTARGGRCASPLSESDAAALTAAVSARLGAATTALHSALFSLASSTTNLDQPLEAAVLQAVLCLPLPGPTTLALLRSHATGFANQLSGGNVSHASAYSTTATTASSSYATGDDRILIPWPVFLATLALTAPLRAVVLAGLEGGGSISSSSNLTSTITSSISASATPASVAAAVMAVVLTELGSRGDGSRSTVPPAATTSTSYKSTPEPPKPSKLRMLLRERIQCAEVIARPWLAALAKWGFTRLGQLVHMPAKELAGALASALPLRLPANVTERDAALLGLVEGVPPLGIGAAIASVVARWVGVEVEGAVAPSTQANGVALKGDAARGGSTTTTSRGGRATSVSMVRVCAATSAVAMGGVGVGSVAHQAGVRAATFDARYTRGPLQPVRARGGVSAAEIEAGKGLWGGSGGRGRLIAGKH